MFYPADARGVGRNLAPRNATANGGASSSILFVHAGFIELVLNIIGLVVIGHLLERLVGHVTFDVVSPPDSQAVLRACSPTRW